MNSIQLYIVISSLCVFLILAYGNYRCSNKDTYFKDPLLTKLGVLDLDGWSLTHVLFYVLLGYLFPEHFVYLMLAGILWEIVEEFVLNHLSSLDYHSKCSKILPPRDQENRWWFGRVSDIPMNALGFVIGYRLAKLK